MSKFASSVLPKITSLNARHRIIAEGGIPPLQYENIREKWAMAERFGEYGLKSGVDIRKLWPTVEEIEEVNALRLYRKASEAQQIGQAKAKVGELRVKNRLAKIEANWKKHDKMLAEYYDEQAKIQDPDKNKEEELQKRVREVQEYFGYWIDPNDPRFEFMLKEKKENAKLEARLETQKENIRKKKQK